MGEKAKGKKIGRNKKKGHNARYINERRHNKSHLHRIDKHLKEHPGDQVAVKMREVYYISSGR
jgi:hypothetical protein